jgi:hypothetical protein
MSKLIIGDLSQNSKYPEFPFITREENNVYLIFKTYDDKIGSVDLNNGDMFYTKYDNLDEYFEENYKEDIVKSRLVFE